MITSKAVGVFGPAMLTPFTAKLAWPELTELLFRTKQFWLPDWSINHSNANYIILPTSTTPTAALQVTPGLKPKPMTLPRERHAKPRSSPGLDRLDASGGSTPAAARHLRGYAGLLPHASRALGAPARPAACERAFPCAPGQYIEHRRTEQAGSPRRAGSSDRPCCFIRNSFGRGTDERPAASPFQLDRGSHRSVRAAQSEISPGGCDQKSLLIVGEVGWAEKGVRPGLTSHPLFLSR